MKAHKPAAGAPTLRTAEGEVFPGVGKMIDPANRYYARLINEGALEVVTDKPPETKSRTSKPAADAASSKETRK